MSIYNKIKSVDIKVFPTAYRGQKSDTLSYNPEARLNSEFNLTHLALRGGSKDAFVVEEKSNEITFSIHGYLFTLYNTQGSIDTLKTQFTPSSEIWAYIKVEALNDPSYDGTNYEAFTLTSFKPNTRGGESKIPLDDEGIFYGINFVSSKAEIDADTSAGTKYPLKLYEKVEGEWKVPASSKLNITTNEIEDGNSGKPISEQLTTGTVYGNATTATAFESAATVSLTGDVSGSATSTHSWDITTTIGTSKVLTSMISDANVTTSKIADHAVTNAKIEKPYIKFINGHSPGVNPYYHSTQFSLGSSFGATDLVYTTKSNTGIVKYDSSYGAFHVEDGDQISVIPGYFAAEMYEYSEGKFPNASMIGVHAFESCRGLISLTIPNVEYVGAYAFAGCNNSSNNLYSYVSNFKSIGQYAFKAAYLNCSELNLPMNSDLKTIENGTFAYCKFPSILSAINIGNSINTIGANAFTGIGVYNLNINLSSHLYVLGDNAFSQCNNLSSVNISVSGNLVLLGNNAFASCPDLSSINIRVEGAINNIRTNAFANCPNLTEVKISASTGDINVGDALFSNCSNLRVVSIYNNISGSNISNIFNGAFNIEELYLDNYTGGITLVSNAFTSLTSLICIKGGNYKITKIIAPYINDFNCNNGFSNNLSLFMKNITEMNIKYISEVGAGGYAYNYNPLIYKVSSTLSTFTGERTNTFPNLINCIPNVQGTQIEELHLLSNIFSDQTFANIRSCNLLQIVDFPNLTGRCFFTEDSFKDCPNLNSINFGRTSYISASGLTAGHLPFSNTGNIISLEFNYLSSIYVGNAGLLFGNLSKLETIYFRGSSMVKLTGSNFSLAFAGTKLSTTGYIYVPYSLLNQYITDSNWTAAGVRFNDIQE